MRSGKNMKVFCTLVLALAGALGASGVAMAQAAPFPERAVTIVVPFPPAGGADTLARILSTRQSAVWKRPVIVENRPGASGHIGAAHVAKSAPDGYTLMMSSTASLTQDNVAQFAPIALVSASPYVVAVNPKLGVKTIAELIAHAKSHPGKLTFGSSGKGSASHLTVELFKQMAGVDMLHVPYKGTGQAVSDLLGGAIDLMFAPGQTVLPHVKAGKLQALAVTSAVRAKASPDLPTVAEAGLPGYAAVGWFGLLAPAGTPKAALSKLSADFSVALQDPAIEKTMLASGAEPANLVGEEFGRFIRQELDKWTQLEKQMANNQAQK
ncbi:MAG: Bug family tripartite tricarboxylate transporter substrate binding protein [Hylemonella sp.]